MSNQDAPSLTEPDDCPWRQRETIADNLRAAMRFNGLPPDFVAAVKEIAPGIDPEQLAGAAFDARHGADRAQRARAELRPDALAEIGLRRADLEKEARALRQRRARERDTTIDLSRILLLAAHRVPDGAPAASATYGWATADDDRLEELERRIAILRDVASRLDGRGAARSWLRDFAEAIAPAIVILTGRRPTITRPTDTSPDKEWRGSFAALLIASAILVGEEAAPASAEAVVAEIAKGITI